MENCHNIFVILEANSDVQPALVRAEQIAKLNGGNITLCIGAMSRRSEVIDSTKEAYDFSENPEAKQLLQQNCEDFLETFAKHIKQQKISVQFAIGWADDPIEGILQAAVSSDAHLIIKASRHHSKLKTLFYTPTDWKLLRQSPAPVLMVHAEKPAIPRKTLAAVSAISVDDEHRKLDHKVLDYAAAISKLLSADLKVINAYTAVPLGVSLDGSGIYQDEYLQELEQQHHNKTLELTRSYGIKDEQVETRNGDPNNAICECVEELGIDLVIMGTLAREGIAGMFIGNTAEQILEKLDCEILTVKQRTDF